MNNSKFNCPSCGKPLAYAWELTAGGQSEVFIWCPNVNCENDVADEGGAGRDEQAAYNDLMKSWNSK